MKLHYTLRSDIQHPEGYFFKPLLCVLVFIVLLSGGYLSAQNSNKIILQKSAQFVKPRLHPYTPLLQDRSSPTPQKRGSNYERLLVIMVQFQPESPDDPNTTGNGQFQLEADPNYLYSIGSPPHNQEYFRANLEALKYYYRAVSCGVYNLQYEVQPAVGNAITLSRPMGYYNPPGASPDLFVQRMEEYFAEVFTLADQLEPGIDFSAFAHYMIIHAGSDWQHDVAGDTPSDLPSFFIRVPEEKAISVNGGAHKIYHACNVPATISQDFKSQTENGIAYWTGYGALNSVIAHEFAHSLGLLDLYNVYTFQPMVGVFDIMDSGGGGVLIDALDDGSRVMVEGILPALPGAFSRALLFEDQFRQAGYMKDLGEVETNTNLPLAASSLKQSGNILPHIYKIPLNSSEYILVENRSVDPDNDGATAVHGTLDLRVVLYPTAINDDTNQPTYEYDYLLPSFQRANGDAEGGGILVWHINEDIIYNQGVTDTDGTWVSNFDNNSVNTDYHNRGVKVLEADGLPDIGNYHSWYWTGTPYEYFHKSRPVLGSHGEFVNWSLQPWRPSLGPQTEPALQDTYGTPSQYWLAEIGNPAPVMSFQLRSGFFDHAEKVALPPASIIAPLINTSFQDSQLPVINPAGIHLYSLDPSGWYDMMGEMPMNTAASIYGITKSKQTLHPFDELVFSLEDRLRVMEVWDDAPEITDIDLGSPPSLQPLAYENTLYAATQDKVIQIRDNSLGMIYSVPDARKLAIAGEDLLVLRPQGIVLIDRNSFSDYRYYRLDGGEFGDYEPVAFKDAETGAAKAFAMSNAGDIWLVAGGKTTKIFSNNSSVLPTQMGLLSTDEYSPVLFFGLDNKVCAMLEDGTILKGFPYNVDLAKFQARRQVYALRLGDNTLMQIPMTGKGYYAIDIQAQPRPGFSMSLPYDGIQDQLYYDDGNERLYWYYANPQHRLDYQWLALSENPILWAGYRNSGDGQLVSRQRHPAASNDKMSAYIYPNPVTSSPLRIRAQNLKPFPVEINVFDASGALVLKSIFENNGLAERDFQFEHKLSSGVYFLTIKNSFYNTRLKFAVIK